jgi:APA family basic amino acid/polyamine antiporter
MPKKTEKIGLWTSTSLVVGNMIGAGIFLMPATLASFGSISLLGWVFAAIGTFFLARVFNGLSKMVPMGTGDPYAYTRHGFGDFMDFLVGWGYYLSNVISNAAIAISFVSALSTFFPFTGNQRNSGSFNWLKRHLVVNMG